MASTKTTTFPVTGMHCASCAQVIKRTLCRTPGVEQVESYYGTEEAVITYDENATSPQQLSRQLEPLGYALQISHDDSQTVASEHDHGSHSHATVPESHDLAAERRQAEFGLPIALLVLAAMTWEVIAMQIKWWPILPLPEELWVMMQFLLASVMLLGLGQQFISAVWLFLRYRKANMDTLVGIGTMAAFSFSVLSLFFVNVLQQLHVPVQLYFDVVIVVIGFVKYGKYLESSSKRRTGEALRSLLALQAKMAWVKSGITFLEKPVDKVQIGEVVQVKPGAIIPLDGEVIEGEAAVDESMITGEALPVQKNIGDHVIGGTTSHDGRLLVKVTQVGSETVLAKIVQLVKQAQNSKAPIERLADQVSAVFVPVVLVMAVLSLVLWSTLGTMILPVSQAVAFGISNMLAVLVIACPCALGLATPTAIIVGIGRAARQGILIKNAESLEQLQAVDTVVFDKTGTLTVGRPTVQEFRNFSNQSDEKIWQIIGSLEQHSEHPLAKAVSDRVVHLKVKRLLDVSHFKNLAGLGLTGKITDQTYWIGNEALLCQEYRKDSPELTIKAGESILILFTKQAVLATVTVSDQLKESSLTAINQLKQMGVTPMMLSGDHSGTVKLFAEELGITEYQAEVKPADKLEFIRRLQAQGKKVAMIGDGINDAPALAAADVSIAMSTGTDVAITMAQVTVLHGDLTKVVKAFSLSHRVMNTIKQNLFWAFGYNVLGIPLAAGVLYPVLGVLLNPAFAGFAMAFSSVSVVLNSLRLKWEQKD